MHSIRIWLTSLLLLLGSLPLLSGSPVWAKPLVIVTGERPPYVSEHMQEFGPAARIIRRAFELGGIAVQFRFFPWKRCEAMLDDGTAFASFPYPMSERHKRRWNFSQPLFRGETHAFFMEQRFPRFEYHGIKSLRGYTVAGSLGDFLTDRLYTAAVDVDLAPDEECSFKKLYSARSDILLTDRNVGWYLIHKYFPGQEALFQMSRNTVITMENALAVSRSYPDAARLLGIFNAGLAEMKRNGEFDSIWNDSFCRKEEVRKGVCLHAADREK
ncbi:MAG: substrate-binding periplasmic protein [Halodesulfovibrio sp.]